MSKMVIWAMAGVFLAAAFFAAPGSSWAQDGAKIYADKCVACHGEKGDGMGPMAKIFNPPPGSFGDPKFWQGDVDKKISESITKGKGQMVPIDLKPAEIKEVSDYMKKTFKK